MKTIVITGGTDGIGRYLADRFVERGDRVVVIGRSAAKGAAFLEAAGDRGDFRRTDLDSVARNRELIEELRAAYPVIDALVLCARFYRSSRTETSEGLEATFAHFYLSRYLLSHGLREPLERAADPVVVNVAGPGADLSAADLDDPQLTRDYAGGAALGHNGKLNDLLGVSFAERYPDGRTRYALVHPGVTATAFAGEYDTGTLAMVRNMAHNAKPVAEAADPILELLDAPPREPLSAFVEGAGFRWTAAGSIGVPPPDWRRIPGRCWPTGELTGPAGAWMARRGADVGSRSQRRRSSEGSGQGLSCSVREVVWCATATRRFQRVGSVQR